MRRQSRSETSDCPYLATGVTGWTRFHRVAPARTKSKGNDMRTKALWAPLALVIAAAPLAAALAAIGIFGVTARAVASRSRELGIRSALGARGGRLIGLVLKDGFQAVMVGTVLGLLTAYWVSSLVSSQTTFLLLLLLFLLVLGAILDIFSAIVLVVPLILPISQVYGIHPLHLGIIFLANLELGYLTPPVGMNRSSGNGAPTALRKGRPPASSAGKNFCS